MSLLNKWLKENLTVQAITLNALVAALYAVITYACAPLSYDFAQFRFSEALNLLVFFNPTYTIGLTLGCLLANFMSSAGMLDVIFGTLATFVSCLLMIGFSKLIKNLFLSSFIPSIINAIVVPLIIYFASLGTANEVALGAFYFYMAGFVFLGEFVCITCIGYPIFLTLTKKSKNFCKYALVTRNLDYKW